MSAAAVLDNSPAAPPSPPPLADLAADQHTALVNRIAARLRMSGGDPCGAEDDLQDAIVAFLGEVRAGKTIEQRERWLYRVGVRRGYLRRRRESRVRQLDGEAEIGVIPASADRPVGGELDLAELRLAVRVAIKKLPRDCALVIDLAGDGLRQSEIAAKLGWPVYVVRWRLQKGYSHLRKLLHAFCPTESVAQRARR